MRRKQGGAEGENRGRQFRISEREKKRARIKMREITNTRYKGKKIRKQDTETEDGFKIKINDTK